MRIVIDPGHGGFDPGAISQGGVREADVNLAVAKKVAAILGTVADVSLTRNSDIALGANVSEDLWKRVQFANNANADLFVSVHCNSVAYPSACGTETYCCQFGGNGEKLARLVHDKLVWLGLPDRGVKEKAFYVINKTKMPAVLIELAFLSNPVEAELLANPVWQQEAAEAIASGVAEHISVGLPVKEVKPVAEDWKVQVVEEAKRIGLISADHDPDATADKAFVLAVVLNAMKVRG